MQYALRPSDLHDSVVSHDMNETSLIFFTFPILSNVFGINRKRNLTRKWDLQKMFRIVTLNSTLKIEQCEFTIVFRTLNSTRPTVIFFNSELISKLGPIIQTFSDYFQKNNFQFRK